MREVVRLANIQTISAHKTHKNRAKEKKKKRPGQEGDPTPPTWITSVTHLTVGTALVIVIFTCDVLKRLDVMLYYLNKNTLEMLYLPLNIFCWCTALWFNVIR